MVSMNVVIDQMWITDHANNKTNPQSIIYLWQNSQTRQTSTFIMNTVNVVIFAGGKFCENVGKTFPWFHVGVIFAKQTKARKTRKLPPCENFHVYSRWTLLNFKVKSWLGNVRLLCYTVSATWLYNGEWKVMVNKVLWGWSCLHFESLRCSYRKCFKNTFRCLCRVRCCMSKTPSCPWCSSIQQVKMIGTFDHVTKMLLNSTLNNNKLDIFSKSCPSCSAAGDTPDIVTY